MDYVILSTLRHDPNIVELVFSYDIACKWSINLATRIREQYPSYTEIIDGGRVKITYFVPKMHLPGHGSSCQTKFSFNYAPGVGRTHGETVEQEWAHINGAALATREMGAGARHATLDDNWGGWNWRKILAMSEFLHERTPHRAHRFTESLFAKNLITANTQATKQQKTAEKFDAVFPANVLAEWWRMVKNWEIDKSKPDPYAQVEKCEQAYYSFALLYNSSYFISATTLAAVRLQLAQGEAEEVKKGTYPPHKITGSIFLKMGLDLEDRQ